MTRRLVLWDIDGTLVSCGPSGREALEEGARKAAGLDVVAPVSMGGRTDPEIVSEMLLAGGVDPSDLDAKVRDALAEATALLAGWQGRIRREGFLHPGVLEVLQALSGREGVRQSLVTGNVAPNAMVKLGAFGILRYFDHECGAYGTDHAERDCLVPISMEKVRSLRGESYDSDEVWVIGDTARDLRCARAGSARCLIVGTGREGFDAVRELEADVVLKDLSDTEAILDILLGTRRFSQVQA